MTHTQTQGADGAGKTERFHKRPFEAFAPGDTARRKHLVALPMDVVLAIFRERLEHYTSASDPDAATQEAGCELEKAMGIFPNLDGRATPAPAATPGVPDSLRALSEAATPGPWSHRPLMSDKGSVYRERFITDEKTNLADDMEPEDAEFVCALVNWFRSISTQPAGQAGDAGAETERLREAVSKALHDNQFLDDWREMVDPVVDAALAARPEAPSDAGWSREDLEAFVAREWPEGRSAGAAARELVRALGVRGLAPTLQRLLTDLLGQINFASTDRAQILADFANAAPEAARMAKIDSFERWNPRVFDPTPPSDPAPSGQAEG